VFTDFFSTGGFFMKKLMRRQRRNVVWTMIVCILMHTFTPALQAQEPETGVVPRLQKLNQHAAVIDSKLEALEPRVEGLRTGLNLFRANNAQISAQIKEISEGNTELEATLYDLSNVMIQIRERQNSADADLQAIAAGLQGVSDVMQMTAADLEQVLQLNNCTAAELQQINCLLQQANCILCKLPANIKRAKIRAFIFGFVVGMGVSAAIGGPGGAAAIPKLW
jgi:septal ring factor EnvC (AmiA/AmiB activator)